MARLGWVWSRTEPEPGGWRASPELQEQHQAAGLVESPWGQEVFAGEAAHPSTAAVQAPSTLGWQLQGPRSGVHISPIQPAPARKILLHNPKYKERFMTRLTACPSALQCCLSGFEGAGLVKLLGKTPAAPTPPGDTPGGGSRARTQRGRCSLAGTSPASSRRSQPQLEAPQTSWCSRKGWKDEMLCPGKLVPWLLKADLLGGVGRGESGSEAPSLSKEQVPQLLPHHTALLTPSSLLPCGGSTETQLCATSRSLSM